jgi:hypothetical protein
MAVRRHAWPARSKGLGAILGAICLAGSGGAAPKEVFYSANYPACAKQTCPPRSLAWSTGQYSQIYLVNEPLTVPNFHPQNLSVERLTKALAVLRERSQGQPRKIFDKAASADFANGLAVAVAKAGPQQDLLFMIASDVDTGAWFDRRFGQSGRAFLDARGLNLIFGEVEVDFIPSYEATRNVHTFDFGSRSKASGVVLGDDNLNHPRQDWVVIPLATTFDRTTGEQTVVPVLPPGVSSGASSTPTAEKPTSPYPPESTPAQVAPPQPAAGQSASPPAVEPSGTAAKHEGEPGEEVERRLLALQRLRQRGLITEEEYQEKRREVLSHL